MDEAKCIYAFPTEVMDFDSQMAFCAENIPAGACTKCGGELLTYHTDEQSEAIQNWLMGISPEGYSSALIGAYRPCKHCSWTWTDSSPMNEIPWAPWEPNGSEQGDNCIQMFIRGEGDDYRLFFLFFCSGFKIIVSEANGMINIVTIPRDHTPYAKRIRPATQNFKNATNGQVRAGVPMDLCCLARVALEQLAMLTVK